MSRVSFPEDFIGQQSLLETIRAKNAADGTASPVKHYLTQHNINLTTISATAAQAKNHDVNRLLQVKQANNYRQLRDNKAEPVFGNIKKEVQFLKSLYGSNYSELGTWGISIDANGKVTYPSNFAARKDLFGAFFGKNNSYPQGESPLQPFLTIHNIDMAADAAAMQEAAGYDAGFIAATKQAENDTQLRDLLWQPIVKYMRGIADYMKNLYSNNERQLGLWGFNVDNGGTRPAVRVSKLKLGEQKTVSAIVLGTTLNNIGTVELEVHKGKIVNGSPFFIKPGEKLGMQKGWSTATIINTSTLETAVYEVTVKR